MLQGDEKEDRGQAVALNISMQILGLFKEEDPCFKGLCTISVCKCNFQLHLIKYAFLRSCQAVILFQYSPEANAIL